MCSSGYFSYFNMLLLTSNYGDKNLLLVWQKGTIWFVKMLKKNTTFYMKRRKYPKVCCSECL